MTTDVNILLYINLKMYEYFPLNYQKTMISYANLFHSAV